MTAAEIRQAIRRGIREPRAVTVTNSQIDAVVLRGVIVLGLKIKATDESFFNKRTSLTSNTHVFSWPSDCMTILKVWDMEDNAGDITDATNASPINIELVDHGYSSDDIVVVHDVAGNTAANDTWKITVVDDDNFTLNGSTGNAAYTSGGKAYKEPDSMPEITKILLSESTQANDNHWYPREKTIVVDDPDFTDDIIVDYIGRPDAVGDIPSEYHEGLVAFGVIMLMKAPKPEAKGYLDKQRSLDFHKGVWDLVSSQIQETLKASTEPVNIPDTHDYSID